MCGCECECVSVWVWVCVGVDVVLSVCARVDNFAPFPPLTRGLLAYIYIYIYTYILLVLHCAVIVMVSLLIERYVSPLRTNDKGYKSLRAKYNVTGRGSCQFWDADTRASCDPPSDWVKSSVIPRIHVKGLWMMAKEYGILLEMVDCLVDKKPVECPF